MRVPSGVGGKFPTQKPAIDKVAEHIDDVVTVAESITSGQFDKVSVPAVKVVATSIKEVTQVAEVEQYVRMLAQDLSNIDLIGSQLAGVLNVSNNMAVVLLLHSRMADLLDIKKSLVHIDAVAINEERINSVYEIIPDIATLVSHTDKLVRIAGMEPQLNAVFQNLDAIFLIGSNVGHIVNVSTNMETILEASAYAAALYTLIEQIKESEAHIVELEASSKVNAEEVATHKDEVASNTAKVATDKGLVETAKIAAMNAATLAETRAQVATTKAAEAAESAKTAGELVTGVLQDAGSFASTGTLPQPPVAGGLKRSAMWKVTVAGTSGGIELAVGDTLVYTAGSDSYYKIDNTESVTSVQNRRGAVVITAADVGLGNVNNTDDSTKNVLSATKLATARTIGGVSFDGSANINLPGVNAAGNQSTTGNAATATKLLTGRNLSLTGDGTATLTGFDGSANVSAAFTLTTVNSNVGTFTKFTVNAKGLITAASQASRSDLSAPTADISNGGFKITNVAAPTLSTDAATKNYVDSVAQGLVVGPASSADKAIARFSGTSGKTIQNSSATIDDSGNVSATSVQASGTGANKMPVGTTAQRPATPVAGMYRMNTTTCEPEWWDANLNLWTPFGYRAYQVEYIVVAGGGSGGGSVGGGGGAGGVISGSMEVGKGSQLAVIVGAGGSAVGQQTGGNSGSNSSLSNLEAIGGGGGASSRQSANVVPAKSGGSGGGGSAYSDSGGTTTGGSGTTGQGNRGGDAPAVPTGNTCGGSGGGGAGAVGGNGTNSAAGAGGSGVQSSITGTAAYYAGGGGGGAAGGGSGGGGAGGGGGGGYGSISGINGGTNTGGGGGGGYAYAGGAAGAGGSGVVIIRYLGAQRAQGGSVSSAGGYTIHKFTTSGTFSA